MRPTPLILLAAAVAGGTMHGEAAHAVQVASVNTATSCGRTPLPSDSLHALALRYRAQLLARHGAVTGGWQPVLEDILRRLEAAAAEPGLKLTLTVIDAPEPNAMALPGGHIIVNAGMLALARELGGMDARAVSYLAVVLSHELAHLTLGHTGGFEAAALEIGLPLADRTPAGEDLRALGYARECELAADRTGGLYLLRAGWELQAALDFFRAWGERSRARADPHSAAAVTYFRSHPRMSDREAELEVFRGELKRHQARFDDALALIRGNHDLDLAIALLDRVLADLPELTPARHARGVAYHRKWLNATPVNVQRIRPALAAIGAYFLPQIRGSPADRALLAQARRDYVAALSRAPHPATRANLAVLDAFAGRLDSARAAAQRAVREAPDDAVIRNDLGVVHFLAGAHDSARASFEAALRLEPGYLPALFNNARVLSEVEDARADAALRDYIAADDRSEWAAYARSLLAHAAAEPARQRASDRTGVAPPRFAGVGLMDLPSRVRSTLGEPESVDDALWRYPDRGIALLVTRAEGVRAIFLLTQSAGDVNGVSVGASGRGLDALLGLEHARDGSTRIYLRGTWFIAVTVTADGVVESVAVGSR